MAPTLFPEDAGVWRDVTVPRGTMTRGTTPREDTPPILCLAPSSLPQGPLEGAGGKRLHSQTTWRSPGPTRKATRPWPSHSASLSLSLLVYENRNGARLAVCDVLQSDPGFSPNESYPKPQPKNRKGRTMSQTRGLAGLAAYQPPSIHPVPLILHWTRNDAGHDLKPPSSSATTEPLRDRTSRGSIWGSSLF